MKNQIKTCLVWITAPLWVSLLFCGVCWCAYCDANDQKRQEEDGG